MNSTALNDRINKALWNRRDQPARSCITTNESGLKLFQCGDEVLPLIEDQLEQNVFSAARAREDLEAKFPGLAYVVGAYLVIGFRSQPERVISYLLASPEPLLAEAVSVIPIFFGVPKGPDYLIHEPTPRLIDFLQQLTQHSGAVIREQSARALSRLAPSK